MLPHLFKLIWNKKKQNFLLLLEIFIAFIGLCAGFTFILYPYNNYKLPLGFEHENVWVVNFNKADKIESMDSLQIFSESVKKVLLSLDGVENVSYSSVNFPLSGNGFNTEIKSGGAETWGNFYTADDSYVNVLGMKVLEGRWFSADDRVANIRPAVINETLKKNLFGNGDALGKIVQAKAAPADRLKIVGVVADTKDESEAELPRPGLFLRRDTIDLRFNHSILIKVKPGADAALESRMHKTLSNTMNADIEIEHLTDIKNAANKRMLIPFIIFLIIAGFLIINVALGIFGVLWYNIQKRKSEIGLRRAVGATGNAISRQLVIEAVLLATLALVVGSFFAFQFPLLNLLDLPASNYVTAIIYSIIFVYVLVFICALYPGRQAAAIYPAVALHED